MNTTTKTKTALDVIVSANGADQMRNQLAAFAGETVMAELSALAAHYLANANLAAVDRAHGEAAALVARLESRRDKAQALLDKATEAGRQALAAEILAKTPEAKDLAVSAKRAATLAADAPRAEARTAESKLLVARPDVARLRSIVDALAGLAGERPATPVLASIMRRLDHDANE